MGTIRMWRLASSMVGSCLVEKKMWGEQGYVIEVKMLVVVGLKFGAAARPC